MGSYIRVLTDAWPLNFEVKQGRHSHFREDLARALGAVEHRMSTTASKPRVMDVCSYGLWTSSLLVATEQLSRVPFPPARQPDRRIVLILDLRLVLKGITWQLIAPDSVTMRSIADNFRFHCPFAHTVVVRSVSSDGPSEADDKIQVSGQVLEVEFVLDRTLLPSRHGPDTDDIPPPQDDRDNSAPARPSPRSAQHMTPSDRSGEKPSRSRSPRGPTPTDGLSPTQHGAAATIIAAKSLPCDMKPCSHTSLHPKGISDLLHLPIGHDRWLAPAEPVRSLFAESSMCIELQLSKDSLRIFNTIPFGGVTMSSKFEIKLNLQQPLAAKLLTDPSLGMLLQTPR